MLFRSSIVEEETRSTSSICSAVVCSSFASDTVDAALGTLVTQDGRNVLALGTVGLASGLVGPLVVGQGGVGVYATSETIMESRLETFFATIGTRLASGVG